MSKLFLSSFGIRITGMVLTFFSGAILANYLGAKDFGIYTFVMTLVTLFLIPCQSGLPQLIVRELSKYFVNAQDDGNSVVCWAKKINIRLALSSIILVFVCSNLIPIYEHYKYTLLSGFFVLPLIGQISINSAVLRAYRKLILGQSLDSLVYPLFMTLSLLVLLVFSVDLTPELALVSRFIAALITLIVSIYFVSNIKYQHSFKSTEVSNNATNNWLVQVIPFSISEGMRVIQGNYIGLVVGIFLTASSLGIYKVASVILLFLNLPYTIISSIGSPNISALYYDGDYKNLELILKKYTAMMVVSTTLLVSPFVFFGEYIFVTAFGSDFAVSSNIFLIMAIPSCILTTLGPTAILLNMCGQEKKVTKISIYSLLFLIIISCPLLYFFGLEGAAYSYVLSIIFNRLFLYMVAENAYSFRIGILPKIKFPQQFIEQMNK